MSSESLRKKMLIDLKPKPLERVKEQARKLKGKLKPVTQSDKPTISFNFSDWFNQHIRPLLETIDEYLTNKAAEIIKLSIPAWFYFAIIGLFILLILVL